ncbi:MAG: hypothetical protein NVS4B3_09200 [Gemmatimonadaceae bacterium]
MPLERCVALPLYRKSKGGGEKEYVVSTIRVTVSPPDWGFGTAFAAVGPRPEAVGFHARNDFVITNVSIALRERPGCRVPLRGPRHNSFGQHGLWDRTLDRA